VERSCCLAESPWEARIIAAETVSGSPPQVAGNGYGAQYHGGRTSTQPGAWPLLGGRVIIPVPHKILIVDDHDATRRGLQQFFANAGYVVLAASTFDEGKRLLNEQAPDLLIADVRLGDFNGLQLVVGGPALPSIMVTGFPDPVLEAEALRMGAHYLTKPVAPNKLLALVEETFLSEARRQSYDAKRRWDRKRVSAELSAHVGAAFVRIVDISYGGLRFEIERQQPLPPSFSVKVSNPEVSIDVDLIWEARSVDRHWMCGVAVSSSNAAALHSWAALVDTFPSGGSDVST
jgi:DNA-binding response OmpR family regulator